MLDDKIAQVRVKVRRYQWKSPYFAHLYMCFRGRRISSAARTEDNLISSAFELWQMDGSLGMCQSISQFIRVQLWVGGFFVRLDQRKTPDYYGQTCTAFDGRSQREFSPNWR